MIGHLLGDVRFALRLLRRSPGFAATLLLVLVIGISATTAMFSVVESLILAPLPYDHPEELTALWGAPALMGDHFTVSYLDFQDWRARGTTFAQMAAVHGEGEPLSSEGAKPETVSGGLVTEDYFSVLHVAPQRGRFFTAEDHRVGAPRTVVISADLWHRRFASDAAVVGRMLSVGGVPHTVIGVAPEGFVFAGPDGDRDDVWMPVAASAGVDPRYEAWQTKRMACYFSVFGRRRPGVTVAAAQAQMSAIAAGIAIDHPDTNDKFAVNVVELHDDVVDGWRSSVLVLFVAIGLVFLVVCANVANLLLARGAARRGEMAVRAGLGATRARLVMQLLVETMVLFVTASLLSLVVTRVFLDRLVALLPRGGPISTLEVHMDARVLLACVALGLVSAVVFGLAPAIIVSQVEPEQVLKQTAARAGTSRSHNLVRGALVVAQIVLAFSLLAGGGVALRAFDRCNAQSPGFVADDRVAGIIQLPAGRYPDDASARKFVRDLLATVEREPGVESAAVNNYLPLAGGGGVFTLAIEGRPPWPSGENPGIVPDLISPGYRETMGIPLLRGRDLTTADVDDARHVMMLNAAAAERFFPGEDAIGHRITFDDDLPADQRRWFEVVGILGDVRRNGLSHLPVPEAFLPVEQERGLRWCWLVVHSSRADLLRTIPDLVNKVDPELPISELAPMSHFVSRSISMRRALAVLLLVFAVTALVLSMLGIFGLVSYSTAQRTRELAIRTALGATPAGVVGLVLRGAAVLVALGLAVGLVAALALGRFLASQMPGVASFDPLVYAVVPTLLLGTTLLACLAPALRAVRIAPATALRYE